MSRQLGLRNKAIVQRSTERKFVQLIEQNGRVFNHIKLQIDENDLRIR